MIGFMISFVSEIVDLGYLCVLIFGAVYGLNGDCLVA